MSWLTVREQLSAPHIGRGTALALTFWMAGGLLFSLHWAMTFSVVGVLVFSLLWEVCDQLRHVWGKFLWWKTPSDPFDIWDVAADMVGWGLFALTLLVYQLFEDWFWNWPGLF